MYISSNTSVKYKDSMKYAQLLVIDEYTLFDVSVIVKIY